MGKSCRSKTRIYNLVCHDELVSGSKYDAIVLGVSHKEFLNLDLELLKENAVGV